MGLFGRSAPSPRHPQPDHETDDLDHQDMALEVIDAFTAIDDEGLAALGDTDLAAQVRARKVLYDYVDRLWENAKKAGLNPAVRPEWNVVAGMRDLTENLWTRAADVHYTREEA